MRAYWAETWACIECGNMDYNAKTAYCTACGSRAGHKHIMVKVKQGWFASKVIDTRIVDDWRINKYIKRLSDILELEADGEEVAYLADAMQMALTGANQ